MLVSKTAVSSEDASVTDQHELKDMLVSKTAVSSEDASVTDQHELQFMLGCD